MRIEAMIGGRIRALRTSRGLSQTHLGQLVDPDHPWPRQAVSSAESGARAWAISDLLAFSRGLGVSLTDLLGEEVLGPTNPGTTKPVILARITAVRHALDELEADLRALGR